MIDCNRAHPASSATRASNGSSTHACTLEAMRTQVAEETMKIIVCLKQVPKADSILRINEEGTWIQDRDLTYEINESDAYGLEAALQLKEKHGGEGIALSLGPAPVQSGIKKALARGADRAIHLEDAAFEKRE